MVMPLLFESALRSAAIGVIPVFAWRALAFLYHALLSSSVRWHAKLLWGLPFALLLLLDGPLANICRDVCVVGSLTLAYFCVIGAAVFAASRARSLAGRGNATVFALLLVTCLLVPSLAASADSLDIGLLVGWEFMLAGYSYYAEQRAKPTAPRLSECLFFLLVNPTVVYPESGQRDERPWRILRACSRCLLGVGAWIAQDLIGVMVHARANTPQFLSIEALESVGYVHFVVVSGAGLLTLYLAHSGLAHLRIGLMGFAGYRVPECYRFPLFARNPQDFWQRWNTWVGTWFRRYVFFPTSLKLGRRLWAQHWRVGAAVMLTFFSVGLLHDSAKYAGALASPVASWPSPKGVILFLLFGATLVLWEGARRAWHAWLPHRWSAPAMQYAVVVLGMVTIFHSHLFVWGIALWIVK